jgi:hypothetical protein
MLLIFTIKPAQKWFNSGSSTTAASPGTAVRLMAAVRPLAAASAAHGGGGRLAEIVEATKSIVTSMAGYHGRLVAQAIATTYR